MSQVSLTLGLGCTPYTKLCLTDRSDRQALSFTSSHASAQVSTTLVRAIA